MKVMVDFSVWLGVEVDTETGEVLRIGVADDVGAQEPENFYVGDVDGLDLEFLPVDHPDAVKALEIVGTIETIATRPSWTTRIEGGTK